MSEAWKYEPADAAETVAELEEQIAALEGGTVLIIGSTALQAREHFIEFVTEARVYRRNVAVRSANGLERLTYEDTGTIVVTASASAPNRMRGWALDLALIPADMPVTDVLRSHLGPAFATRADAQVKRVTY